MAERSNALRITQKLNFDEVLWAKVLDQVCTRFKTPFRRADDLLRDFFKRFLNPFNLYWFIHPKLSEADNNIFVALCEVYGADAIELSRGRQFRAGPFNIEYLQDLTIYPRLTRTVDQAEAGTCVASITFAVLGLRVDLRRAYQVLLFHALVFVFAVLSYVVCVGLLLYGVAVFIHFIDNPLGVVIMATRDPSIGLALLCFLIGCAGIFGRAVKNLFGLARQAVKRACTRH